MITQARNFLRLPRARKRLLAEAAAALVAARWTVRRRPFRSYAAALGQAHPGEFVDAAHADMAPQPLGRIRWALLRVNRLAGGRFTCLMLAIAAKRMLNRRGLPNTLVLGVRMDNPVGDDPFAAHAWLRAGRYTVVGVEERAGHVAVASYHSAPPAPPNGVPAA